MPRLGRPLHNHLLVRLRAAASAQRDCRGHTCGTIRSASAKGCCASGDGHDINYECPITRFEKPTMPWTAITDEGLGALPPPRPHVWIAVSSVATVALAWALTSVAHASPPRNLMFTSG